MILQALNSYYQRLSEREDSDAAPEGFAPQSVSFALLLDEQGGLLDVLDLREQAAKGKKLVPRKMIVPALGKARTVGIEPNFLWDGPGYVLGRDDKGKPERTARCQEAFRLLHEDASGRGHRHLWAGADGGAGGGPDGRAECGGCLWIQFPVSVQCGNLRGGFCADVPGGD